METLNLAKNLIIFIFRWRICPEYINEKFCLLKFFKITIDKNRLKTKVFTSQNL